MEKQKYLKEKFYDLKQKYGTTQVFIANKCGVSKQTINMWLKDKKALPEEVAARLETYFKTLEGEI